MIFKNIFWNPSVLKLVHISWKNQTLMLSTAIPNCKNVWFLLRQCYAKKHSPFWILIFDYYIYVKLYDSKKERKVWYLLSSWFHEYLIKFTFDKSKIRKIQRFLNYFCRFFYFLTSQQNDLSTDFSADSDVFDMCSLHFTK